MGRPTGATTARAFAPGHVTGFFVPSLEAKDPRGRGSTGVGLVLDRGVVAEARYDPRGPARLSVRSRPRVPLPISREVASRLRGPRGGSLEVRLVHDLPVGQGLGMSAAGAVATGLAVARVLGLPARRGWETAHLAELFRRGGLGGVAAIRGGGLEHRRRAGLPPFGEVRCRPWSGPLRLYRIGPRIPSPRILGDPRALRRVTAAGRGCERRYARDPGPDRFWAESQTFTDRVALSSPALHGAIGALRGVGWRAFQAMFGEIVVASPASGGAPDPPPIPVHLPPPLPVAVGRHGAHLLRGSGAPGSG